MRYRLSLLVVAMGIAVSATLLAHHSVPGQFDMSKPVTLKGVITKSTGSTRTSTCISTSKSQRHDQHMGAGDSADRDDAARGSDQGISSRQAR